MPARLEGFQPVVPAVGAGAKIRIGHIYTGRSTVEPLPYLVDAQRRSDRRAGRGTWVLVSSFKEEASLASELRTIFEARAKETGDSSQYDRGRWGVRCTPEMKHLSPKDDCVVVTTTETLYIHMLAAEGKAPRQFSDKITFMLSIGWGNLSFKSVHAYDSLVRLAFDHEETTNYSFCTVSSSKAGPFNRGWMAPQQDCSVTMEDDEVPRPLIFYEETAPDLAMEGMLEELQRDKGSRAILVIDETVALDLKTFGGDLENLERACHVPLPTDEARQALGKLADVSKHVIVSGTELKYLGNVPRATHVVIYPMQEGSVWDRETNQIAFASAGLPRPMAQVKYAMSWRGRGNCPEVHYLGPQECFEDLEDEPIHSAVYTSQFDEHVLSCLSMWPELPVVDLPLRVGRNPYVIEERLRRLIYKGLLEWDETRDQRPWPTGRLRLYSFLKLTDLGEVVAEVVNPYKAAVDGAHAACLVGQLFLELQRASAAMIDAVCSLAVVLTSKGGVTCIDSVIQPNENFKEFIEKEDSLASDHCYRGPIWLAVCVWHFSQTSQNWKTMTDPEHRRSGLHDDFLEINRMALWFEGTYPWENAVDKVNMVLDSRDAVWKIAGVEHRLSSEELLEVEVMLVTAFLDKLAFVFVPARAGTFGYSATTGAELTRPTDAQMRLIKLDKCWEQDKAVEEKEPTGIYCIFTHSRLHNVDGQPVAVPYDLTYVSKRAVRIALKRANVPMADNDLLTKITSGYKLDM